MRTNTKSNGNGNVKFSEGNKRLIKLAEKLAKKHENDPKPSVKVKKELGKVERIEDAYSFNEIFMFGLNKINRPAKVSEVVDAIIETDSPVIKKIVLDKLRFTQQMYNVASSLARGGKLERKEAEESRGFIYGLPSMFEEPKKPVAKKKVATKKKTTPKKAEVTKPVAKKPTPQKPVAKKPAPKKAEETKPAPKKAAAKKPVTKKVEPKKPVAKKATATKKSATKSNKGTTNKKKVTKKAA